MRHAKKLGLLGLSVLALVVAFGILVGGKRPTAASAQVVTTGICATTAGPCSFTTSQTVPAGGTFTITSSGPAITAATAPGCTYAASSSLTGTFVCTTALPVGSTVTLSISTTTVTSFSVSVSYGLGSGISTIGGGCGVVTTANQTVTCFNGQTLAAIPASTPITLTVTASTGTVFISGGLSVPQPSGNACNWETGIPTAAGSSASATISCTGIIPAEAVIQFQAVASTPGAVITECTSYTATSTFGCASSQTVIFTFGSTTTLTAPFDPTGEEKFCNNVLGTNNTGLPAVSTSSTSGLLVESGTSFTIPEFNPSTPTTCLLVPTRGGTICNNTATPVTGTNPCSDGYFLLSLETPNSVVTIGCQNNLNIFAQTAPGAFPPLGSFVGLPTGYTVSGGGGPCQTLTSGTSLLIPCGATAVNTGTGQFTPPNGGLSNSSATCTGVLFTVQSNLNGCASEPTIAGQCGYGPNFQLGGGSATVSISWLTTPGLPNTLGGGIQLGTNTFTVAPPPLGSLLVTATPEAIPSNGTLASVVTATFACGNEYGVTSTGFPLSNIGFTSSTTSGVIVNQPILGGGSAVCGAGLPGTFTFASPGPVLFDNGRTEESVSCGLSAQDSVFGVGAFGNFSNGIPGLGGPLANPTFPLVFTCTGAAVLAIGAGAAGDAPINVTYQSQIGGLSAVGSSLIIVSPSGVPRISVACSPSVIAAGNTGSVCTSTVTDQNGVPLTGITGATVTFTVSDPTEATILPCVVGVPGAINVTTSPNVIPQIVPTTPCNPPSGTLPGQVNTFLNGQATALLVASSYARPEVVTVSASLGVLIPPEFACLVSPYTPVGFGTIPGSAVPVNLAPAVSGVGSPGLSGCGSSNPVGFTGLASALSTDSGGLTGIVTLPNTTSASTTVQIGGPAGILIAGATTTQPLGLLRGCNQLIVTTTAGTPIANLAALVSPAAAVVSIWTFNNGSKQFRLAFSSDPAAPVDITVTGQTAATQQGSTTVAGTGGLAINSIPAAGAQVTEVYFVCVNQSATIISG